MKLSNYNPQYLQFTINSSLATDQYEELRKRLVYCPFESDKFVWGLVYDDGPLFFVVRHMLKETQLPFNVVSDPMVLTQIEGLFITPWTSYDGKEQKVRGQMLPAIQMPLYVEAGHWDVPQCNPVFDWSRAQAWGYLIHHGLVEAYETERRGTT